MDSVLPSGQIDREVPNERSPVEPVLGMEEVHAGTRSTFKHHKFINEARGLNESTNSNKAPILTETSTQEVRIATYQDMTLPYAMLEKSGSCNVKSWYCIQTIS